ncbi:hypothetical protein K8R33_04220 [archaeon]|nr:hypothetical protein [archaeon]
MIELGMLIFGGITGNLALSIGWIILRMGNYIPLEDINISAVAVIVIGILRKVFRSSGVK